MTRKMLISRLSSVVHPAAQVAGGRADQRPHQHHHQARPRSRPQRRAGAGHRLRRTRPAPAGGAQPVRGRRRLRTGGPTKSVGSPTSARPDQRQQREQPPAAPARRRPCGCASSDASPVMTAATGDRSSTADQVQQQVGAQHRQGDGQVQPLDQRDSPGWPPPAPAGSPGPGRRRRSRSAARPRPRSPAPCRSRSGWAAARCGRRRRSISRPGRQALGPGQRQVVLAQHAQHGVAHGQQPAAQRGQHDGGAGQHRVRHHAARRRRRFRPGVSPSS